MLNVWNPPKRRRPEPVFYEIVLKHANRGRFLFMYAPRMPQEDLVELFLEEVDKVIEFTDSIDWYWADDPKKGIYSANGWTLFFSGRHERGAKGDELKSYLA